jgi:cysteine desulfurase
VLNVCHALEKSSVEVTYLPVDSNGCVSIEDVKSAIKPTTKLVSIMHLLDMKGICVSTSSACNSGKDTPSHVLLALGLNEQQAKSSIRISYGRYNTVDDAKEIVVAISNAYSKIVSNHQ